MRTVLSIKNILMVFVFFIAIPTIALADLADDLDDLVGYKIVARKTIDGEFEGCDFDKLIVFDDRTILRCESYGYQYSYRPTAVILFNGYNIKMIVDDEVYDMSI